MKQNYKLRESPPGLLRARHVSASCRPSQALLLRHL